MSEIPFQQTPGLQAPSPKIAHGFFGRRGGVSTGIYDSLNAGPGSNDEPKHVSENRARIVSTLTGTRTRPLLSAYQIHSADVITVTDPFSPADRPKGDALVTNQKDIGLCILTADCTPVLFADVEAGVIGAAHAGWKGALAGVLENTVEAMVRLGAKPSQITAGIGPCLQKQSFEVGPDLKNPFIEKHPWAEDLFEPGQGDRSFFDIASFCEHLLTQCGIERCETLIEDTLTQPERFFSNRFRVKANQSDYGRNASVIFLCD